MPEFPTTTTPSGVVVMRPGGRLNLSVADLLREELVDLIGNGNARLVVDLTDVVTIDSSAVGAIVSGLKKAREAGGDLRIAAPSAPVWAVLKLAGLDRVLPPYPSADTAFNTAVNPQKRGTGPVDQ